MTTILFAVSLIIATTTLAHLQVEQSKCNSFLNYHNNTVSYNHLQHISKSSPCLKEAFSKLTSSCQHLLESDQALVNNVSEQYRSPMKCWTATWNWPADLPCLNAPVTFRAGAPKTWGETTGTRTQRCSITRSRRAITSSRRRGRSTQRTSLLICRVHRRGSEMSCKRNDYFNLIVKGWKHGVDWQK